MAKAISRQTALNAEDTVLEPVPVDEWEKGAVIYVKSMTAAERGKFLTDAQSFSQSKGKLNPNFLRESDALLVLMTACDETGELLFEKSDKAALMGKNASVIARIALQAQKLAGLTKDDLEALEKNSETTLSDASPTD